ncbi:MAG TPA: MFS transporter [Ilumatobacter sp.]|nr:MFS transporter [Ilumatobacter sp.]
MASASFAPFHSRSFTVMWSGALVSNIGTWMETVALAYYVADTTGKASWSAVVAAAGFIPAAVVGPVGSAMADRLDRRRVLITTNALAALLAAILAVWIANGDAGPGVIAALSFIAGAVAMFGFPSFQTSLPDLVPREHLVAAVGLSNAQWNLGRILGPACAALAMTVGGISTALWCNVVSFGAVIVAVIAADLPHREGVQRPIFRALADGVGFARNHPAMRRMLALMTATILIASPFIAFVSQMATNVFDGSAKATSLLVTAQGIGAVIAAFTLGGLTKRLGVWRLLTGAVLLLGPALVLYAIAPELWVAAIGLGVVGLLYGYAFTSFAGVAQQSAPDEMRGRVLAVNSFVLGLLYPIGTLIQGALADAAGLRWVTAASGLTLLAVTIVLTIPHVRRLRSVRVTEEPAPATPAARV